MRELGVKTVLNLRLESSDLAACERAGLDCIHLPVEAWNPEESDPGRQPVFAA